MFIFYVLSVRNGLIRDLFFRIKIRIVNRLSLFVADGTSKLLLLNSIFVDSKG